MWADLVGWFLGLREPISNITKIVDWQAVAALMTFAAVVAALRASRSSARAAQAESVARAKLVLVYTAKFYRVVTSRLWSMPVDPAGAQMAKAMLKGGSLQNLLNDLSAIPPKDMPNTTMVDLLLASRTWMLLMTSVVEEASKAQKVNGDIYEYGPRGAELCDALAHIVRKMGGHAEPFDDEEVKLWLPPWYRLLYARLHRSWLWLRHELPAKITGGSRTEYQG